MRINKINIYFVSVLLLLIVLSCKKDEAVIPSKNNTSEKIQNDTLIFTKESDDSFAYCKFISGDDVLNFRLAVPLNYDTAKVYPLLLFFHGSGERGSDNQAQLIHLKNFLNNNKCDYSYFILAPQCPENIKWADADWTLAKSTFSETPTKPMELTIKLINYLSKYYKTDTSRLYAMGLSMGGFGVWDLITRVPGKFAAAVPICGGGDENIASKIGDIPLWIFHGAKDKLVKVSRSRDMVNALKDNKNLKYDEVSDYGHNVWEYAFNSPELYKWIFEQRKSSK